MRTHERSRRWKRMRIVPSRLDMSRGALDDSLSQRGKSRHV
ncbi:hypothetical protein ALSL_1654 [Aerosticca soli]|uniref:Uncharacterized protein n=1 Tax=Aerosticca soli TaxID=2010829 RepID=A0A2Z6E5Q2_9GAMM|nr:hypothetical protein ALSL_1654 [Aerosticca soli]